MASSNPKNRSEFKRYIKGTNGNVVVYIGATWCGPCSCAYPVVKRCMKDYDGEFVKLDFDESKDVASYMGVHAIPALLGFKQKEHHATCVSSNEHDIQTFFEGMK